MRSMLPWIIIGLSLAGGLGLFIWNALRPEEEEDVSDAPDAKDALAITAAEGRKDLATTTEEYKGSGRKSRILSMKASFEKSLETAIGPRAHTKDRMTMPWFMLVGADGSGKRTVLANSGLPLPYGPPMEVDALRKDAGKWWQFEDAVVVEAPAAAPGTTAGTTTLPPDQTVADASIGWHTLLHMLRRERPDSPLNGMIVTISCADLLGARANPEKLADQAERIRNFLDRTRRTLGVRLPLHVIVTKCDALPGFRTFARALPQQRRDDIFGWANPNDIETRFDPALVENGFESLRKKLADLRDELIAAPDEVSDTVGLFVFDTEFADMQEPLKEFISQLIFDGERRPSLYFRGMYFTGDALDPVPADQALTLANGQQLQANTSGAREITNGEPHNLVFLKSLFQEKIFREAGLARPTAHFRLARDPRVVVSQVAAVALLVGGSMGLWSSVYGWRTDGNVVRAGLASNAQALTRMLSGLAIDLEAVHRGEGAEGGGGAAAALERRPRDAAVIELVGQMREVPSTQVRSAFLPTSWFSPLPNDIRASMMRGVQNIILPVTRQRLQERTNRLLMHAGSVAEDDALDASDPRSLATYLTDVRALSRNIERYNSLASPTSGSVAELSALLDYLFGERFSTDSALATQDFEAALRRAAGPLIIVSPEMAAAVVRRAVASVSSVASAAGRQLAPRAVISTRAKDAEDDLDALNRLGALVELVDAKSGLVATVSDSAILGVKLARVVQDSIEAQLRFAAARIRRDTLSPTEAADSLKRVVGDLYRYRLMAPREDRRIASEIPANQRLRWDVGRLELALGLRAEFLQAVLTLANAFPGQPPERLQRALEVQLRARAVDVAASAQRFTPASAESMLDVRTEAANLEAAAQRTIHLGILLDSLDAGAERRKLLAAGARQAEHTLAMAQALLDREGYFAPQTAKIAAWQGVIPIGYAALGVTDSLTAYTTLINHTTEVRTLAHDVAPALRYLRLAAIDSVHTPRLLNEWEEIATAVARYERLDYTGSLGLLHRYLREGMSMSDVTSCAIAAGDAEDPRQPMDFFSARRRQFHAAVIGRCRGGGSADAIASYAKMRTLFASKLAGRFPFADSTQAADAADADPVAVRDFLRQYDAFAVTANVALRADPRVAQSAKTALAFLDQVAKVRAFMAPYAESRGAGRPDRQVPEFSLLIQSGTDDQREVQWKYGDSVHVSTLVDSLGNANPVYVHGGWAPLRHAVIMRADTTTSIRFFHPDTKIEVMLPVFPVFAPEIVVPKQKEIQLPRAR